jgi:hypothetical protein
MRHFVDAQAALSFMVQQASYIEAEVYRIRYPDIQYPNLIPIDTAGGDWVKSKTFFSMDRAGHADWFHHLGSDMPLADIERTKYEVGIEMAGIGYRYSLEEVGQAMMIPNFALTTERADAARRAAEEFLDNLALRGDTVKAMYGLINNPLVTSVTAIADGTGSSSLWSTKTDDQIIRDINVTALTPIFANSLQVENANTILVSPDRYAMLATKKVQYNVMSVLEWINRYNSYTALTGAPLTIRAVRGLETAGAGGTQRMIAYTNDPGVLKFHLPMPHRFLPVWQTGPLVFDIPGIMRSGGLEIRRPNAMRYVDGI